MAIFLIIVCLCVAIWLFRYNIKEAEKAEEDRRKKAEEAEIEELIKAKKEEVEREIKRLQDSGFVKALSQEMEKRGIQAVDKKIKSEIERFPYKPNVSDVYPSIELHSSWFWLDSDIEYKKIGYDVYVGELEKKYLVEALIRYSNVWKKKESSYCPNIAVNPARWDSYIQKRIDTICAAKGITKTYKKI